MESQNHTPIRREIENVSFVQFEIETGTNQLVEDSSPETLEDAIDAYQPIAKLSFHIGERIIELDPGRDLFYLHSDLLRVLEGIVFEQPNFGPYSKDVKPNQPDSKIYSFMLRDFFYPPVIYFEVAGGIIFCQTRTLGVEEVAITDDDIVSPVLFQKKGLIVDCCEFLRTYMASLANVYPFLHRLDEYKSYMSRIDQIDKAILEGT